MPLQNSDFISIGYIHRSGTAESYGNSVLIFQEISIPFSIMTTLMYISIKSVQGSVIV
jgi:hypothetical protein